MQQVLVGVMVALSLLAPGCDRKKAKAPESPASPQASGMADALSQGLRRAIPPGPMGKDEPDALAMLELYVEILQEIKDVPTARAAIGELELLTKMSRAAENVRQARKPMVAPPDWAKKIDAVRKNFFKEKNRLLPIRPLWAIVGNDVLIFEMAIASAKN